MASPLEDYALIADTESAGLIGRDGSLDWLCLPRFDAGACFAALLGDASNGRWLIAPAGGGRCTRRRYRDGTLVLESDWETADGAVRVIDCMPPRDGLPDVVRVVRGLRGRVAMCMELIIRFDYGSIVPWVRRIDGHLVATGGPDALCLLTPVETIGRDLTTVAEFTVHEGDEVPFVLTWHPSHLPPPREADATRAVAATEAWWRKWSDRLAYEGEWREAVAGSLVVLKALTYAPTGSIVAAPTTSLPEHIGGVRNWDYRLTWLRDATFTLNALLGAGYTEEAAAWRDWLLRSVAGDPSKLQIMYGISGERRLPELELPWLAGYEASTPVRVGNAACDQFQLDVYGEVMDALHRARSTGLPREPNSWELQRALMRSLESLWQQPDEGIWEVRGPRRHFTHSKVMAWVAFDRAVRAVEETGHDGPVARWRARRDQVHAEVLDQGYDAERNTFVQTYDGSALDASLLMVPLLGFLPADDPRVIGTVEAIERELTVDGFVNRYQSDESIDGLPPGEGSFIMCSFWLADCLHLIGRPHDARALFEQLLDLRNDVGLLAEQYDVGRRRMVGNFPQAFSHISLINAARTLSDGRPDVAAGRVPEDTPRATG